LFEQDRNLANLTLKSVGDNCCELFLQLLKQPERPEAALHRDSIRHSTCGNSEQTRMPEKIDNQRRISWKNSLIGKAYLALDI